MVFAALFLLGCDPSDDVLEPEIVAGALLPAEHPYATCLPCHGANGEGNALLKAPRLVGQRQDYLRLQVASFKNEWRGADEQDIQGRVMAQAIAGLDDATLDAAIDYIETLKSLPAPELTLSPGNLAKGKYLYTKNCAICHGEKGEGSPNEFGVPRLNIQYDWYMHTQLEHFRTRLRGFHPDDAVGNSMGFYAQLLGEEGALDVITWLNSVNE